MYYIEPFACERHGPGGNDESRARLLVPLFAVATAIAVQLMPSLLFVVVVPIIAPLQVLWPLIIVILMGPPALMVAVLVVVVRKWEPLSVGRAVQIRELVPEDDELILEFLNDWYAEAFVETDLTRARETPVADRTCVARTGATAPCPLHSCAFALLS